MLKTKGKIIESTIGNLFLCAKNAPKSGGKRNEMEIKPDYQDERQLAEALARENPQAIERMYKKYYRLVEGYVTQNGGQEADARELFNDALVALIINLRKGNFEWREGIKLSAYLMGIARRLWLMQLRQKRKMPLSNPENWEEKAANLAADDGEMDHKELQYALMEKILEQIGTDCRRLLKLFYFEKKEMKEIATLMQYTDEFARQKKFRCMSDFKKRVLADADFLQHFN